MKEVPAGLSPTKAFPNHLLPFLSKYSTFLDAISYGMDEYLTVFLWSSKWIWRFCSMDLDTLQAVGCVRSDVILKSSLISNAPAGSSVFASCKFGTNVEV